MRSQHEKDTVLNLRSSHGLSISEISEKTNIPRETITRWVARCPLTEDQQKQLALRNPNYKSGVAAGKIYSDRFKQDRLGLQEDGRNIAKKYKDVLWVIGAMLYWGEGGKTLRHTLDFANSDPYMISIFMKFLRDELCVHEDKIKLTIYCYNDISSVEEIELFWLNICGLERSNLTKTMVNKYPKSSKRRKIGKSQYGTCKVRVFDVKKVQPVFGFIKEIAGITDKNLWS